ncbi:MAG: hypothetical protein O7F71_20350 [Gammaproteobacteria bacterium]|nr:hypothetical protein [Gammaproteobacteria bacterium]
MQKLFHTILFAPLLMLSACASLDEDGCRRVSTTLRAVDANKGGNNPRGFTRIRISPDTVTVKEGCTFTINNPGNHTINTISAGVPWLTRPATEGNLKTEKAAKTGGNDYFKFTIIVEDIGQLDPRVRVL